MITTPMNENTATYFLERRIRYTAHSRRTHDNNNSSEKSTLKDAQRPEQLSNNICLIGSEEREDSDATMSMSFIKGICCKRADRISSKLREMLTMQAVESSKLVSLMDDKEANRRLSISLLEFPALHDLFEVNSEILSDSNDSVNEESLGHDRDVSTNLDSKKCIDNEEINSRILSHNDTKQDNQMYCKVSQTVSTCTSCGDDEERQYLEQLVMQRPFRPPLFRRQKRENNDELDRIDDDISYLRNIQSQSQHLEILGATSDTPMLVSSRRRFVSDPTGFLHIRIHEDTNLEQGWPLQASGVSIHTDPDPISCQAVYDRMQQPWTTSMRRLVVTLKEDTCASKYTTYYRRQQAFCGRSRRRGHSCPVSCEAQIHELLVSTPVMELDMSLSSRGYKKERKRDIVAQFALKLLRRKVSTYLLTDEELMHTGTTREKIEEIAFRYGGAHRQKIVQELNKFSPVIKHGRHGVPHVSRLHCNQWGTLQWQKKRGRWSSPVDLADALYVIQGCETAVFRKSCSTKEMRRCSFSLIFCDRSLDMVTPTESHRNWLMRALESLIVFARMQRRAEQQALSESAVCYGG